MYGPDKFCELLDVLTTRPAIRPACRAVGIDASNFWLWLSQSAAGDERFRFEWSGQVAFFHEHVATARKKNVVLLEGHLRDVVQNGQRRQVVFNGKLAYAFDESIAIEDRDAEPDVLALLYDGRRDPFARDELGKLVPLTVLEPVPAHLQIRAAAALMPNLWGERKTVDINQAISGGVMVLSNKPREPQTTPTLAPPVAPVEHVELIEDTMVTESHEPAPLDHEPVPIDDLDAATPRDSDTPLIADLRARLRRGVVSPAPRIPVMAGRPEDEDDGDLTPAREGRDRLPQPPPRVQSRRIEGREGLGAGDVLPGGFKTA